MLRRFVIVECGYLPNGLKTLMGGASKQWSHRHWRTLLRPVVAVRVAVIDVIELLLLLVVDGRVLVLLLLVLYSI